MNSSLFSPKRATFLVAPLIVALPSMTHAAWEAVPELSFGVESYDNILRESENEQAAARSVLDAGVRLTGFNERGDIFVAPRVTADAYTDSDYKSYESQDIFLNAGGQYRWPNVGAAFRMSYYDRNVLRAEFADAVLEDPDVEVPSEGDTGRVTIAEAQRRRAIYNGGINYRLSQRNQLQLDASRLDVSYSGENTGVRRTGYDNTTFSTRLAHGLNERTRIVAGLFVSQYYAERNDNTTDTTGMEVSFNRSLSPLWTVNVFANAQENDYDFLDVGTGTRAGNSVTNTSFGFGFRKRSERSTWNLNLQRRIEPNSNGFINEVDSARVFLSQQFTPRLTGTFGALVSNYVPVDDLDKGDEREYARIQVELEWSLTRTLLLVFGLDSFRQEFVNESSSSATANSAYIGLTYRGLSRQNQ